MITHDNCFSFNIFTDDCVNISQQNDVDLSDGNMVGVTNETISNCEDNQLSVTGWY